MCNPAIGEVGLLLIWGLIVVRRIVRLDAPRTKYTSALQWQGPLCLQTDAAKRNGSKIRDQDRARTQKKWEVRRELSRHGNMCSRMEHPIGPPLVIPLLFRKVNSENGVFSTAILTLCSIPKDTNTGVDHGRLDESLKGASTMPILSEPEPIL